jgi:hypothetical protein
MQHTSKDPKVTTMKSHRPRKVGGDFAESNRLPNRQLPQQRKRLHRAHQPEQVAPGSIRRFGWQAGNQSARGKGQLGDKRREKGRERETGGRREAGYHKVSAQTAHCRCSDGVA